MKSALILGGSGFLGSSLSIKLKKMGLQVYSFSRTGDFPELAPEFLLTGDFKDPFIRQDLLSRKFDYIFHLISTSTPSSSELSYSNDVSANVLPTLDYIENLNPEGLSHFIFISSGGAVYGNSTEKLTEESRTLPISSYGVCKITIENYLRLVSHKRGFKSTILRPTNPYGIWRPNQKPFGFINNLLDKCIRGESFGLVDDGKIARDFIYIDDVTDAIVSVLETKSDFDTFNISSGTCISLSAVLETCRELGIYPKSIVSLPTRPFDPQRTHVCSRKLQSTTGWRPKVPLKEGILKTYEELKKNGRA